VRAAMNVNTQASPELEHLKVPEGAVRIELGSGSYPGGESGVHGTQKLGYQLMELVKEEQTGSYGGHVVLPESTVLMFYGADAEALLRVMEPTLRSEALCQGARVTIRQGAKRREMMLPGRVM